MFSRSCLALSALALLAGCQSDSQLVIGILTNLKVTGELSNVEMDVSRDDVIFKTYLWDISDQRGTGQLLPGSINLYSENGGTPIIDVLVTGYLGNDKKVARETQIQLSAEQSLFYRMSLVRACQVGAPDATCPANQSCVEGLCEPITIDQKTLLAYDASRTTTIECDSGSQFIDSGTCGSGTCAVLPIGSGCASGQFCSEGTCYQRDPASPRALEFGELCDATQGDGCRETGLVCAATPGNGGAQRCRVACASDNDCTRELPDATAAKIATTNARCTPAGSGARVCTFACDPISTTASGCPANARCAVVFDSASFAAADCVTQSSTGGTKLANEACTAETGSVDCATGLTCAPGPTGAICLPTCRFDAAGPPCATGTTCTPLNASSEVWGVCNTSG